MCLMVFALDVHPRFRLIVCANRDEYYKRPARRARFWEEEPSILAGRDMKKNGTWLGITKNGRFAAVTNFRNPDDVCPNARTRGELVTAFLKNDLSCEDFLDLVHGDFYNGFNLFIYDGKSMFYHSNVNHETLKLTPGIYGVSNGLLDSNWPKVTNSKKRFKQCLDKPEVSEDCLFQMLENQERPFDHELPETGVGLELERLLSSPFVKSHDYGTRTATIVMLDRQGNVKFKERCYDPDDKEGDLTFSFQISKERLI